MQHTHTRDCKYPFPVCYSARLPRKQTTVGTQHFFVGPQVTVRIGQLASELAYRTFDSDNVCRTKEFRFRDSAVDSTQALPLLLRPTLLLTYSLTLGSWLPGPVSLSLSFGPISPPQRQGDVHRSGPPNCRYTAPLEEAPPPSTAIGGMYISAHMACVPCRAPPRARPRNPAQESGPRTANVATHRALEAVQKETS